MPVNLEKKLRIRPGERVNLGKFDAGETHGVERDEEMEIRHQANLKALDTLQYRLFAEGRRSLLIVLQGIDTAGKDGTIRKVFTAFNPQGCTVTAFKAPTAEEKSHDYLWRIHKACPGAGHIGVFNRSHYEDVLVVRVHGWVDKPTIERRYDEINRFERLLADNGTTVIKIFLYIDKDEQKERFQARLKDPEKNWKFSSNDLKEREFWNDYLKAFEDTLSRCSTKDAPWYLIPANRKWFRDFAVAEIVRATLEEMNPQFPPPEENLRRVVVK